LNIKGKLNINHALILCWNLKNRFNDCKNNN